MSLILITAYYFLSKGDAETVVRVNMFLRSISKIDDYDMVSRHNRRGKDIYCIVITKTLLL